MILIIRPKIQAKQTKFKLKGKGFRAICYPFIGIEIISSFKFNDKKYDGLIITSQNTAHLLKNSSFLKDIKTFVVGLKTSAALTAIGFKNIINVGNDHTDLVKAVEQHLPQNSSILYLHGDYIAGDIKGKLEHSYIIDNVTVYRSIATDKVNKRVFILLRHIITTILFYSPRTAQVFAQHMINQDLSNITAICISKNTALKLASLRFKEVKISKLPNENSMLEIINK